MILLYPLLALSLRVSKHPVFEHQVVRIDILSYLAQTAWLILNDRYRKFDLDGDYLRGACLLAQVDFSCEFHLDRRFPS